MRRELPAQNDLLIDNGMRLLSIDAALCSASPSFFQNYPTEARTVLSLIVDGSKLLTQLLEEGRTRAAGRIAGALRSMKKDRLADDIVAAMRTALYDVRETNPFLESIVFNTSSRPQSASVHRIQLLWETMRHDVIQNFRHRPKALAESQMYLKSVEEVFLTDAYNSLSIEGYQVSTDLIKRIKSGQWTPDQNESDREHKDALAARGYWQAFQKVKISVQKVLEGAEPGTVLWDEHGSWYRELFGPSVTAGIIPTSSLAGYRTTPVFIRNSQHVPLNSITLREAMPALFELISEEPEPEVKIVLGHFFFVFIHPYTDGNGRMARFLMNVLMASGGFPWTVIRMEGRRSYMTSLKEASVRQNIIPFTTFISDALEKTSE